MNTFIHILWFKNLMFWKLSTRYDLGTIVKNIGSFIVFGSFAVGAFYFSNFITSYLLENVGIGLFLFHRFIGMLLFVFFITINLGNMVVSFSTLYRTPEVHFLLSSPVSYLNIFVIKFLDNFFYSSGTLFMVGFSVLLGYGVYFNYPWHFYLLIMFGVLIPFMFLAACVAVIVLLLAMKLASKVNFRILASCIILFYIGQIYLYFKVTSPVNLVQEVMKYYPYVNLYFGSLDPSIVKVLPNYWVSEILYFYVMKNYFAVTGYVLLLVLSTAGAFVFALAAANRMYYSTWITSLSLRSLTVKRFTGSASFFGFGTPTVFSPQTEVLLKKEFWQFVREPSQWIHFVVMMALLTIFLTSISTLNIKLESAELKAVVYLVVFIFNIFLINSIALRFGFPLISLEGNAYWSLRSAPIALSAQYWIKFSIIAIFLLVLSLIVAYLSNIPYLYPRGVFNMQTREIEQIAPHSAMIQLSYFSIAITPIIALTLASVNFSLGSVYANFIEKNPIRIASSQGATMTFLLTIVYLVILLALYYFPVLAFINAELKDIAVNWNTIRSVALLIVVPSFIIIGSSHFLGLRSLRRDY
ncbi:MAG: putative ABC transporter permease subunit [Bacteroidota bacterium]